MQLRRCLRHLLPKKAPWLQGTRPLDETHRVRRRHVKKGAAKKSLVPKKVHACSRHRRSMTASLHHRVKTPRCSKRWHVGTSRSKPSTSIGLRWPPQAARLHRRAA